MKDAYDYASLHHFDYWTTVLGVSPHKNSQWINEIGASFNQEKMCIRDRCSPGHKGHDDLTSSPPSSGLSPAVSPESPT